MLRSALVLPFSIASVLAAFAVPHGKQRFTVVASASTATVAAAAAQAVTVLDQSMQCEVKVQCDRLDACTAAAPGTALVFTVAGLPPLPAASDETSLGVRGIAFVVHPHRALDGLDRSQVADLFAGRLDDWSQLGGPSAPIRLLRTNDPDDQESLSRWLGCPVHPEADDPDAFHGDSRCLRVVAGDPFAIGTMSVAMAERAIEDGVPIKILALDGRPVTSTTVTSGSYPLVRTLQLRLSPEPDARNDRLLEHLAGEEGSKLLAENGYQPVSRD